MTDDRSWGVWGGRAPGGWCEFGVVDDGSFSFSHVATRERASAVAAQLAGENPAWSYEAVPYDAAREPAAASTPPTLAEFDALVAIDRNGSSSVVCEVVPGDTLNALQDQGWVMLIPGNGGRYRATRVGAAFLDAGRARCK